MDYIKIIISFGLSSLFITIINFCQTSSFEFGGIIMALLFIGYGVYKINQSKSLGYIIGYLLATSTNGIVLGSLLATYSSPFLIAETVTIALDEVMTFNHWLAFSIGLILIFKGIFLSKKNK